MSAEPLAQEGSLALLGAMMGVAAFVAVFIVSSTFVFAVAQRRRDLALLRLTGASQGQMRKLLLGEALLLGTVGSCSALSARSTSGGLARR